MSERRSCAVLRFDRKTHRYRSVRGDQAPLRSRIKEIAETRVRYGYRRIHVLLRREGWAVNVKRVRRLYRMEGLNLRAKRPRRHVMAARRVERPLASRPNEIWAMDFVSDALFNGRRFRALTVVDAFSREAKGEALWSGSMTELSATRLPHKAPTYPFVARDYDAETEYAKGFSVGELMPVNSVGIVTARDDLTIDMDREALWARVEDFTSTDPEILRDRYGSMPISISKACRRWPGNFKSADTSPRKSGSRTARVAR